MDRMVFEQAEQLINRAGARFYVAKDTLAKGSSYYPEVISACIDSMELATKAVALCLGGEYPEAHDFGTRKYEELLGPLNTIPHGGTWRDYSTITVSGLPSTRGQNTASRSCGWVQANSSRGLILRWLSTMPRSVTELLGRCWSGRGRFCGKSPRKSSTRLD